MTRRPSNVDKIGRSKHFLFTLLLLTLVLGFCLFLIEFGFTRFYYSNVMQIEDKKFDPLLGWSYKPGVYWVKPPQSFRKHTVSINKHGIRNRELKEHPSDQRQRIVILGDSFCFGKLVPQEHLFSTRLEKELNRKFPNHFLKQPNLILLLPHGIEHEIREKYSRKAGENFKNFIKQVLV